MVTGMLKTHSTVKRTLAKLVHLNACSMNTNFLFAVYFVVLEDSHTEIIEPLEI